MPLQRLTSRQLFKGTGSVMQDLDYAEHLTNTDEPGYGEIVCSGKQLRFVNRAIRIAREEIKQLRKRLEKKDGTQTKGHGTVGRRAGDSGDGSADR